MDTTKVQVTVAWPDKDTTEWFLTYPRTGEYLADEHGDLWEVTRVFQVPVPKAEYVVTVDKPAVPPA